MSEEQESSVGLFFIGVVIIFLILRWLFGAADNTK